MIKGYNFEVIGKITSKARPRITKYGAYTPKNTKYYENYIKLSFVEKNRNREVLEGYLKVDIIAVFQPPKSTSKKNYDKMLKGEILPAKKPDIDNIAKVVLDALSQLAYKDDNQVVSLNMQKIYGVREKLIVTIEEL